MRGQKGLFVFDASLQIRLYILKLIPSISDHVSCYSVIYVLMLPYFMALEGRLCFEVISAPTCDEAIRSASSPSSSLLDNSPATTPKMTSPLGTFNIFPDELQIKILSHVVVAGSEKGDRRALFRLRRVSSAFNKLVFRLELWHDFVWINEPWNTPKNVLIMAIRETAKQAREMNLKGIVRTSFVFGDVGRVLEKWVGFNKAQFSLKHVNCFLCWRLSFGCTGAGSSRCKSSTTEVSSTEVLAVLCLPSLPTQNFPLCLLCKPST